jgi:hypothetical protein
MKQPPEGARVNKSLIPISCGMGYNSSAFPKPKGTVPVVSPIPPFATTGTVPLSAP